MHARVVLGVGKVSCLERCPQFKGSGITLLYGTVLKAWC